MSVIQWQKKQVGASLPSGRLSLCVDPKQPSHDLKLLMVQAGDFLQPYVCRAGGYMVFHTSAARITIEFDETDSGKHLEAIKEVAKYLKGEADSGKTPDLVTRCDIPS